MKKRGIKRYKPKKRLRVKLTIKQRNNLMLFFSYAVLGGAILFFVNSNYSKFIQHQKSSFFKNTIVKAAIDIDDSQIKSDIEDILSPFISRSYSKELIKEVENTIKKIYPYLKISHSFNPITGNLTIKAKKIFPIARIKNKELYLLEDLSLSEKNPQPYKRYPIIEIPARKEDFLNLFLRIHKTELFNLTNSTVTLYLESNNPVVDYQDELKLILPWDFKATNRDIERIRKVITDAKKRIDSKLIIDARYIYYGKIIAKPSD